jgi:hypothetical protein
MKPKEAIISYCRDFCMNGQPREVKLCADRECPLWGYRGWQKLKDYDYKLSRIKSIKKRCHDCHLEGLVSKCEFVSCQLYPYRTGHNPSLTGKRGNPNILSVRKNRFTRAI